MNDDQHDAGMRVEPSAGPVLARIAAQVIGQPLYLHPAKAEIIYSVLQGRLGANAGAALGALPPEATRFMGGRTRDSDGRPSLTSRDGDVAIIHVVGSLVNRGSWVGASSGLVSYEGLAAQVREAEADPDVRSIVLDVDSPGGEATGMLALAAQIRAARERKRVVAVVNDVAASAGYGIAAAASEVVVSPSSFVGSIGVVMMRLDRTGELAKAGIAPTLIYAGRFKTDGHPLAPMGEDEKGRLTAMVGRFYDLFVESVAAGRGARMEADAIRATEAGVYVGADAIAAGLADREGTFGEVIAELRTRTRGQKPSTRRLTMDNQTEVTAAQPGISPEAHETALNAARAEARGAERERIAAIMRSPEAEGRTDTALTLALDTDMSAEGAAKVLASVPKAAGGGIAARAAAEQEIGAGPVGIAGRAPAAADQSADKWRAAIERVNKRAG